MLRIAGRTMKARLLPAAILRDARLWWAQDEAECAFDTELRRAEQPGRSNGSRMNYLCGRIIWLRESVGGCGDHQERDIVSSTRQIGTTVARPSTSAINAIISIRALQPDRPNRRQEP